MNVLIISGKNHATLEFLEPVLHRIKEEQKEFQFYLILSHRNKKILLPWVKRFKEEGLIEEYEVGPAMWRKLQAVIFDNPLLLGFLSLWFPASRRFIRKIKPTMLLLESSLVPESRFLNLFALHLSWGSRKRSFLIPHSPHYTGVVTPFPYLKKHLNAAFEVWIPRKGDEVRGFPAEVAIVQTGYPAFDKAALKARLNVLQKNEKQSDLLYMIREWRGHQKYRFHSSYDSVKKVTSAIFDFAQKAGMTSLTIKPHPSLKDAEIQALLADVHAPEYGLEINVSRERVETLVGKDTFVA